MASFNQSLPTGSVVVATEDKYNDNDGAYHLAYVWNGETVSIVNYSNGYNNVPYNAAVKDANPYQVEDAVNWWINVRKDLSYRNGNPTFIGCVVTLQRSRKAPNKTPLKVINHELGGYNSYYMQHDPERVCVEHEGQAIWVSVGCIKEVVQGARPWWA